MRGTLVFQTGLPGVPVSCQVTWFARELSPRLVLVVFHFKSLTDISTCGIFRMRLT